MQRLQNELQFAVPLIPPSVNHYKLPGRRGGFYRAAECISFTDAVCIFSKKEPVGGQFYEVHVTYYLEPAKFLRFDADNFLKVSFDALKAAGVIRDDRYIVDHHVHKRAAKDAQDVHTSFLVKGRELL